MDAAISLLSQTRLDHRIDERGDREFRRLIRHFNRMSHALESMHSSMRSQVEMKSRQLLRSEQLAAVGTLAAGLAHEINNPLAIIAGHSQTTLRRLDRASSPADHAAALAKARDTLQIVCQEAFRCRDIASQLLHLAQPIDRDPEPIALDALAGRAIDLIHRLPASSGHELIYRCDGPADDLTTQGHPAQLLQVLLNLLTNSLEACEPNRGRILLSLERRAATLSLSISDNGRGMTPDTLAHAFEPFFTDKPRRGLEGCGLGLSISHAIVERHQGRLYATSEGPHQGTTFTLELPATSGSPISPAHRLQSDLPVC